MDEKCEESLILLLTKPLEKTKNHGTPLALSDQIQRLDPIPTSDPISELIQIKSWVTLSKACDDKLLYYSETDTCDGKLPYFSLTDTCDGKCFYYPKMTETDCILRVDDVEIPVHRAVLSAQSEVFAAMFRHDTKTIGIVDILDVNANVLKDMIHYIYSRHICGLCMDTAISMYVVAKKYGVVGLMAACLDFIKCNLTIENVLDAVELANQFRIEELKNSVLLFIQKELNLMDDLFSFIVFNLYGSEQLQNNCGKNVHEIKDEHIIIN